MIEVVPYSAEHQAGVIDLILPIQQSEFSIPITLEDQPDLCDIPAFYQSRLGNFWVALAGPRIVGTVSLPDIGNAQGALRKMFVHVDFREPKYGVARHLLETLLGASVNKFAKCSWVQLPSFLPPIGSTRNTASPRLPSPNCRQRSP